MKKIIGGTYATNHQEWHGLSQEAKDFVKQLLVTDPSARMSAEEALQHPWILYVGSGSEAVASVEAAASCEVPASISIDSRAIAMGFLEFAQEPPLRRACLELLAWTLPREERSLLRDSFMAFDPSSFGVIKISAVLDIMRSELGTSSADLAVVEDVLVSMDEDDDGEIHYSNFLAAAMSKRLVDRDSLIKETFRLFDSRSRGFLTQRTLHKILGESAEVDKNFQDADRDSNGRISVAEFIAYVRGDCASMRKDQSAVGGA